MRWDVCRNLDFRVSSLHQPESVVGIQSPNVFKGAIVINLTTNTLMAHRWDWFEGCRVIFHCRVSRFVALNAATRGLFICAALSSLSTPSFRFVSLSAERE